MYLLQGENRYLRLPYLILVEGDHFEVAARKCKYTTINAYGILKKLGVAPRSKLYNSKHTRAVRTMLLIWHLAQSVQKKKKRK